MDELDQRATAAARALDSSVARIIPSEPPAPRPRHALRAVGVAVAVLAAIAVALSLARGEAEPTVAADAGTTTTQPVVRSNYYELGYLPDGIALTRAFELPSGAASYCTLIGPGAATTAASTRCPTPRWVLTYSSADAAIGLSLTAYDRDESEPTDEAVTVRGVRGSISSLGDGAWRLTWPEGDLALSLFSSGISREELMKVAGGIRGVSDADWQAHSRGVATPPDPSTGTVLARVDAPGAPSVRLVVSRNGLICLSIGDSCTSLSGIPQPSAADPKARMFLLNRQPGLTAGVLIVPNAATERVSLTTADGLPVPSAQAANSPMVLFVDTSDASTLRVLDARGAVITTVELPRPAAG